MRQALTACGVTDAAAVEAVAARCAAARRALGQPTVRWSASCVVTALHAAVARRAWPADLAVTALLAVAADPQTRSPMRVAEGGPWWGQPPAGLVLDAADARELAAMEARLDALDGGRPALQRAARAELVAEELPLTRSTVVRRACAILDRQSQRAAA